MNDVKTKFYKTLNIIVGTNRVDNEEAYIINDYIGRLEATIKDEQQEIKRLNNIIEEKTYLYNKLSTESEYAINKLNNIIDKTKENINNNINLLEKVDFNEKEN